MDILKKFLNNSAFEHLAENIISFMDTDEAMETMIESELLSNEERKAMQIILRKLMVKEAQMFCEKKVEVKSCKVCKSSDKKLYCKDLVKTTLYEMYPFFKDALQELKKSESLESFNQLYDILVWLQPGETQLDDENQLQNLYDYSIEMEYELRFDPDFFKGPAGMIEVFEDAADFSKETEDEDEDVYDGDLSGDDFEDWNDSYDSNDPYDDYDYDHDMMMASEFGWEW